MNVTTPAFRKLTFGHQDNDMGGSWLQSPSQEDQLATTHRQDNQGFFASADITFTRIDHMLEYKTSLNKFEKIGIIPSIFYDHIGVKLKPITGEKLEN